MTEFNYPPERTIELGSAVTTLADRLDDLEDQVEDLEEAVDVAEDDDPDPGAVQELREAHDELQKVRNQHDALQWAVQEWDEEATVRLRAIDTGTRARVEDTIQTAHVGQVGPSGLNNWMVAAGLVDAPFLDDDDELEDKVEVVAHLPPGVTDWLDDTLDDLQDLGN